LLARALGVFLQIEDLEAQLFAERCLEPIALGVDDADLSLGVIDLLDHRHVLVEIDRARLFVVARLELSTHAEGALGGRQDRLFHRLDQDGRVDTLFLADLVDDALEGESALLHGKSPLGSECPRSNRSRDSETKDEVRLGDPVER